MKSGPRRSHGLLVLAACGVALAAASANGCGSGASDTFPLSGDGSAEGGDATADAPGDTGEPDSLQSLPPEAGENDAPTSTEDAETDGAGSADGEADAETSAMDGGGADDATATDAPADGEADGPALDAASDANDAASLDSGIDAAADAQIDSGAICDPVTQVGCPAADKCTINPPTCVPNGTVANGATCGPTDDCVAGELCTSDGSNDICREFCASDEDCKQAPVSSGSTSEPNNVAHCLVGITSTTYTVCTVACNPVTKAGPSGCATGTSCTYGSTTGVPELTDCETVGTAVEGATCTATSDCGAGLVCLNNGTTLQCRDVCRNATSTDCAVAGDVCFAPSGVTSPMFGFCCPSGGC